MPSYFEDNKWTYVRDPLALLFIAVFCVLSLFKFIPARALRSRWLFYPIEAESRPNLASAVQTLALRRSQAIINSQWYSRYRLVHGVRPTLNKRRADLPSQIRSYSCLISPGLIEPNQCMNVNLFINWSLLIIYYFFITIYLYCIRVHSVSTNSRSKYLLLLWEIIMY